MCQVHVTLGPSVPHPCPRENHPSSGTFQEPHCRRARPYLPGSQRPQLAFFPSQRGAGGPLRMQACSLILACLQDALWNEDWLLPRGQGCCLHSWLGWAKKGHPPQELPSQGACQWYLKEQGAQSCKIWDPAPELSLMAMGLWLLKELQTDSNCSNHRTLVFLGAGHAIGAYLINIW